MVTARPSGASPCRSRSTRSRPASLISRPSLTSSWNSRRGAWPQLGRERQPQLAPGRRQLDFRGAQDDLARPRQELQAGRLAGLARALEAGQLDPAVDDAPAQLQALDLDALEPAAQELARTVTDLQAREAMIRRRAVAEAGQLDRGRPEPQILERGRLEARGPQTGAQQRGGEPEQGRREAGDQQEADQQDGDDDAEQRPQGGGPKRAMLAAAVMRVSSSYGNILTECRRFA